MEGVNPAAAKAHCLCSGEGGSQMTWRFQVWLGILGGEPLGMSTEMGILFKTRVTNQNWSDSNRAAPDEERSFF